MLTNFNYIIFNNKQQNKQIDFVHSTVFVVPQASDNCGLFIKIHVY